MSTSDAKYTESIMIRATPEMKDRMESIAMNKGFAYVVQAWRDAADQYIEAEGDAIGSRRLFSRQMGQKLNEMEQRLSVLMLLSVKSNVGGFATLLEALNAPGDWSQDKLFTDLLGNLLREYPRMKQSLELLIQRIDESEQKAKRQPKAQA